MEDFSVMEDFFKVPGGKDLIKMKVHYEILWMMWVPNK